MNKNRLEHLLKKHHQNAFMWASQCYQYNIEEGKAVYNEKSTFKTWLFSVIRFTALDHLKKQQSFEGIEKLYTMLQYSFLSMKTSSLQKEIAEKNFCVSFTY